MTAASRALAERLDRVLRQLRALSELQVRELGDLGERAATIARLHADELRIALEELQDIHSTLAAPETGEAAAPRASAKRERWLAEQDRLTNPPPRSRREMLGMGEDREPEG